MPIQYNNLPIVIICSNAVCMLYLMLKTGPTSNVMSSYSPIATQSITNFQYNNISYTFDQGFKIIKLMWMYVPMYIKPQVWCCPTNRATHKDFMLVPTPNVPNYHRHWIYLTKVMSCPEKDKCCIENINPYAQRCVMCNMYVIICIYICIDIYRQYLQLFITFYWCLNNIVLFSWCLKDGKFLCTVNSVYFLPYVFSLRVTYFWMIVLMSDDKWSCSWLISWSKKCPSTF